MKYVQHENVVARSVAGENLLIPVQGCTDRIYTLNGVGRGLWEMLATPHEETALAEAVVTRYKIPIGTAVSDVRRFLDHLARKGLVDTVDEAVPGG